MTQTSEITPTAAPAVDFESLLAPISVAEPAGESLRYEGTYDAIEELRREDDHSLPQGVWKHKLKKAQWPEVAELCFETLETRTKDLKIAAWLCEAWLHLHGFAGLEAGVKLLAGLCESFWEELHPRLEEGDPSLRMAPLEWLDDHLTLALKQLPVTRPQGPDAVPYGWADWERALYYSNLLKTEPAASKEPGMKDQVSREKVQVSVTLTPSAFYQDLAADLERAETAVTDLVRVLNEAAGDSAPTFHQIRETLTAIRAFTLRVLEQRAEDEEILAPAAGLDEDGGPGIGAKSPSGPIRSRAEAYRQLSVAAEYLLRTEPHSPAPYLVRRAVSWGNMPLAELFRELLQGGADLRTIYTLLGIKETPE